MYYCNFTSGKWNDGDAVYYDNPNEGHVFLCEWDCTVNKTNPKKPVSNIEEVFNILNKERTSRGLDPLDLDDTLCKAADTRAQECGIVYAHSRPDGRSGFSVLDDYGIKHGYVGENIAKGYNSPESVMNAWMNSSGHKANILDKNYTKIGIGYDEKSQSYVQLFIS